MKMLRVSWIFHLRSQTAELALKHMPVHTWINAPTHLQCCLLPVLTVIVIFTHHYCIKDLTCICSVVHSPYFCMFKKWLSLMATKSKELVAVVTVEPCKVVQSLMGRNDKNDEVKALSSVNRYQQLPRSRQTYCSICSFNFHSVLLCLWGGIRTFNRGSTPRTMDTLYMWGPCSVSLSGLV